MRLSEQIKKVRMLRGWSQDMLSDATGIERSILSRIENGHVVPKEEQIIAIKQALSWPTSDFESALRELLDGETEPCHK